MKTRTQPRAGLIFLPQSARAACLVLLAISARACLCALPDGHSNCAPVTLRGHVEIGESYTRPITPALDFKLEAVPAGWMVRVLPHGDARPPHDYAELANPPYRSPTPLLISTDFAFRAQDAVAWNPRVFRYFEAKADLQIAESVYRTLQANPSATAAPLLAVLPNAKESTLTIIDAELSGGTANQTAAAARVASHFDQTAHRIRSGGPATALGKLLDLTFQVSFPAASCPAALSHREKLLR